ncbi:alkaline shock response membrane anchor protein AmaP [Anaerobranca gottschalkii]|uniref:Uncharacterized conserved protein YloU, alkaline shock protein (Asp23) family n=1 Tax=Anaerobranca gottschalkii DSM 13577 TaxID=1120990 RepID=A0A1H9Y2L1_9FIRM|nr:alkaline shock response membrane anchor protein AmaP [Anaerobranca gottschalkii]SES62891.1 Uncharacterized conserved protein YloU, alkaline shock protein (Asp23) family [Anaerobranca gottschalkii DSM 13577]
MLLKKLLGSILGLLVVILGGIFLVIASGFGKFPSQMLDFISSMEGSIEYIFLFLIVVLLGFLYICLNLQGKAQPTSILVPSELGEVRISLESIDSLVHQAVKTIKGIKDLKTKVILRENGLFIYVKVVLYGDRNIPELSQQMQGIIQDHVYKISGVNVSEVKVLIENVATDFKTKVS